MLVRLALLLLISAFILFFLMAGVFTLGFASLAELMRWIATETLLAGSALLVATALCMFSRNLYQQLAVYFSTSARVQRRLWFIGAKKARLDKLLDLRKQQLNYFNALKRRHLLNADNAKQMRLVAKIVKRDLKRVKHKIPRSSYLQMQQQMDNSMCQCDVSGLLDLQQQLSGYR